MNSEIDKNSNSGADHRKWFASLLVLFGTFLVYSFVCCPVPAVNEPHYLTKAKHYWNPEWCAGDFFLESSNPHQVFYQTVGLLTRSFSLETTAIIGRVIGYLLLALGWQSFFFRVTRSEFLPVAIAWIFLGLMTLGNLSGEWMIGGIESKVFSYGFLLLAWSCSLAKKNRWMMVFHGLAISFHPVVGVWGLMANLGARLFSRFFEEKYSLQALWKHEKKAIPGCLICAGLLVFFSLPGLVPAVQLISSVPEGIHPDEANHIQVFYRLKHHLDPMQFPAKAWGYYLGQFVFVFILYRILKRNTEQSDLFRFVLLLMLVSCLFALGGLLAGWRTGSEWEMPLAGLRMKLLKFYSFRLADVLIPMTLSMLIAQFLLAGGELRKKFLSVFALLMLVVSFANPPLGGNPSRYSQKKLEDWRKVCEWIDNNLPENIQVMTPKESWAFKWYAKRPEYVCLKDCPQDAAGIVEWNDRLLALSEWGQTNYDNGYTSEDLAILNREFGITHLVASRLGPINQKPVYKNDHFRVYEIEDVDE